MFSLQHLDHVAITVTDLERSRQWYCDILGMEHVYPGLWDGVPIMLQLGPTLIALFPAGHDSGNFRARGVRVDHFAFRADQTNFEHAQVDLRAKGIDLTFQDHDVCHSIYFTDPDGHRVEITTYELDED